MIHSRLAASNLSRRPVSAPPRRSKLVSRFVLLAARLSLASFTALAAIDVLGNLALIERLVFAEPLAARPGDFLAVALFLLAPAAALVLVGLLTGAVLARILRSDAAAEGAAAATAAVTGFAMLGVGRLAGNFPGALKPVAYLAALAVATLTWWMLRRTVTRSSPSAGRMVLLPLAIAFGNLGWARVSAGAWAPAIITVAATLLLAVGVVLLPRLGAGGRRLLTALPPAAAVLLAALAIAETDRYGGGGEIRPLPRLGDGPPAIVLVVLDTVRADRLSFHGYGRETTPGLAAWARDAAVFEHALSPAGWTSPSHASFFTGLPVSLHGVRYARELGPVLGTRPLPGLAWLPGELADFGYRSVAVSANPFAVPPEAGFDRLLDRTRFAWEQGTLAGLLDRWNPALARASWALRWRLPYLDADQISGVATRAIPERGRVFLFVNFLDAHSPFVPPGAALDALGLEPGERLWRYDSHRTLTTRWDSLPEGKEQELSDLYDGELRGLDGPLTRLLEEVDRRWHGEALVIVTSDHGEELGEEGRVGHEHGLHQRILHVPLLVRGPGVSAGVRPETVTTRRVHDLILATAGGAPFDDSLLSADDAWGLLAERYPSANNEAAVGSGALRPWVSRVEGDLKAVGPSSAGFDLWRLDVDFRESRLSGEAADADRRAVLAAWIDSYWSEHRDARADAEASLADPADLQTLRSLGYVQ